MYELEIELAEYLRKLLEDFEIIDRRKLTLTLKDINNVLKVVQEIKNIEQESTLELEQIGKEITLCSDSKLKEGTKAIYLMNQIGNILLDESQNSKAFSRAFVMPEELFIEKLDELSKSDLKNKMYNLCDAFDVELNDVVSRTKELKLLNF